MSLLNEHEEAQTWGGHQPILGALARLLDPELTVECGCGRYSTAILARHCRQLVTVEHDPGWAARVRTEIGCDDHRHRWMLLPVEGIDNATPRHEIGEEVREGLDHLYAGVAAQVGRHRLLFVDTFTAARVPAVTELGPLADVIAIHDTEADHPDGYRLGEAEGLLKGMHRYSYQPHGWTTEWHRFTWTEVFSREVLDLRALTEAAAPAAAELWGLKPWLVYLGKGPTGWKG